MKPRTSERTMHDPIPEAPKPKVTPKPKPVEDHTHDDEEE